MLEAPHPQDRPTGRRAPQPHVPRDRRALNAGPPARRRWASVGGPLRELDLRENVVEHVGLDHPDAVGILVTYAARASIVHNDVAHLPYTGISLGWGWGTDSYARDNVVRANHVWDVMRVLRDGGGIDTLSSQPGTVIDENLVTDVEGPFGALYLDEGSADLVVAANVVERAPRWLHVWTTSILRNLIVDNVSDTDEWHDGGTANLVTNNVDDRDRWPPEAAAVAAAAGVPRGGRGRGGGRFPPWRGSWWCTGRSTSCGGPTS